MPIIHSSFMKAGLLLQGSKRVVDDADAEPGVDANSGVLGSSIPVVVVGGGLGLLGARSVGGAVGLVVGLLLFAAAAAETAGDDEE